jgi:hypothetical protein
MVYAVALTPPDFSLSARKPKLYDAPAACGRPRHAHWLYDCGSDEARLRLVRQLPVVAFRPLNHVR